MISLYTNLIWNLECITKGTNNVIFVRFKIINITIKYRQTSSNDLSTLSGMKTDVHGWDFLK